MLQDTRVNFALLTLLLLHLSFLNLAKYLICLGINQNNSDFDL